MRIFSVILGIFFLLASYVPTTAHASLFVCQNSRCNYVDETLPLKPWIRKLHKLFKTPNVRMDFCESSPQNRSCVSDGIKWVAQSAVMGVGFDIPVARTLPQQNTLIVDYLVRANESLPTCGFSQSTFEPAENHMIRLVSRDFSCRVTDIGEIHLQNTFFIDYIDFDNAVIGAQYTIQTHGEIQGIGSGYTLIKFRDGNTLKPLVPMPDYGDMPDAPDAAQAARYMRQQDSSETSLTETLQDWWQDLKDSLNLDKTRHTSAPNQPDTWWNRLTNKALKIFYLEPLD